MSTRHRRTTSRPPCAAWSTPNSGSDIVELGMVRDIDLDDGVATIGVALTIAACPMRDQIEGDVVRKVHGPPRDRRRSRCR